MRWLVFIATGLVCTANAPGATPVLPPEAFPTLPPKSPEEAVATFDLDPSLRIELVAAEPLIADPVAISFDENGALYVCEMRDYSERREEKLGRISRLEDRDADGRMDHATVFAAGLPWPTGVLCYDGGVFVLAAPDLWFFKDTNGDGGADERRVVLTGFSELAARLNVQQLPNSLRWGPDQRVHLAEGGNGSRVRRPDQKPEEGLVLRGRDLSFHPRTLELRAESGGGQYGMAFDDFGRKFVSSNSRHLMQIAYDVNLLTGSSVSLPPPAMDIAVDGPAAPVFRRSPDEAWRVIRTRWRVSGITPGLIEGGGTPSGYFTGATGVQIYLGDALPSDFVGNAFVADTGSNLIHRKRLIPDGVVMRGARPLPNEHREFLASTDNWFRPVQIENGPSGGLYIVDLYREIIEHPWSLPPAIKEHLDLNRGNDRGRIWRITAKTSLRHRTVRLGESTTPELVGLLGHANGWHRDTAARVLIERDDVAARPLLERARLSPLVHARLGALSVLAARNELDASMIAAALRDSSLAVRLRGLQLAARTGLTDWRQPPGRGLALALAADPDAEVRLSLALVVGASPPERELALELWRRLAPNSGPHPLLELAALRLMEAFPRELMTELDRTTPGTMTPRLALATMELPVRATTQDQVRQWLVAAAEASTPGGVNDTRRLLLLAAAVGRGGSSNRNRPFPDLVDLQIAEAALRTVLVSAEARDQPPPWIGDALSLVSDEQMFGLFSPLLPSLSNPATREAIGGALATRDDRHIQRALLESWAFLSPRIRSALLEASLRKLETLNLVLDRAATDGGFRDQLGPSFRKAVREHADRAVRERGRTVFGEPASADAAGRRAHFEPALSITGEASRGRDVYLIRCASCHRAHGEGYALGPDLLTVAAAGRETLLANILDPHREVAPRFEAWSAKSREGEEFLGILADDRPESVLLRAASGVEHTIARSDLTSLVSTGKSLMPDGLDEGLSAEQMADLLRFIESLAEAPAR